MFRRAVSLSIRNTSSFFRVSSRSFSTLEESKICRAVQPFLPKNYFPSDSYQSVGPSALSCKASRDRIEECLKMYGNDYLQLKTADFDGAGTTGEKRGKGTHIAMHEAVEEWYETNLRIANLKDFSEATMSGMGGGKLRNLIEIVKFLAKNDTRLVDRYKNFPALIEKDAEGILKLFIKKAPEIIYQYATPNPGIPEMFKYLRSIGIQCNLQTAYGKAEADAFQKRMAEEGVIFDQRVCGSDVTNQRPSPALASLSRFRSSEKLSNFVFPHQSVFFGDTENDAKAVKDSWFIGLSGHSALLPLNYEKLSIEEQVNARMIVAQKLAINGAHYVINPENPEDPNALIDAMKVILPHIGWRMRRGEMPSLLGVIRPTHEETLTDKIENAFRFTR